MLLPLSRVKSAPLVVKDELLPFCSSIEPVFLLRRDGPMLFLEDPKFMSPSWGCTLLLGFKGRLCSTTYIRCCLQRLAPRFILSKSLLLKCSHFIGETPFIINFRVVRGIVPLQLGAGRKSLLKAHTDLHVTLIFPAMS